LACKQIGGSRLKRKRAPQGLLGFTFAVLPWSPCGSLFLYLRHGYWPGLSVSVERRLFRHFLGLSSEPTDDRPRLTRPVRQPMSNVGANAVHYVLLMSGRCRPIAHKRRERPLLPFV